MQWFRSRNGGAEADRNCDGAHLLRDIHRWSLTEVSHINTTSFSSFSCRRVDMDGCSHHWTALMAALHRQDETPPTESSQRECIAQIVAMLSRCVGKIHWFLDWNNLVPVRTMTYHDFRQLPAIQHFQSGSEDKLWESRMSKGYSI